MWYAKLFYVKETVCGTRKGGEALLRGNVLRGVVDVGRGRQTGLGKSGCIGTGGRPAVVNVEVLPQNQEQEVGMKMRRVWGQEEKRKI